MWSRDVTSDTGKKVPYWGFSISPLVVDDVVIVAAAGQLVAYDLATGDPRWFGPASGESYSSPHLLTIDGVAQILLLSGAGATSVALADGTLLWEHPWPGIGIVQPALTAEGDVLISMISSAAAPRGTRRIAVAHGPGQLVLLPDQDLLLVVTEQGELALVGAAPDQFTELARFPAIEGKTWNHPVLVGDVLLVRNGQEMVAFRLSLAGG